MSRGHAAPRTRRCKVHGFLEPLTRLVPVRSRDHWQTLVIIVISASLLTAYASTVETMDFGMGNEEIGG